MPRRTSKSSLKERRRRARTITVVLSGVLILSATIFLAVVLRIPETRVVSVTSSPVMYASNTAIEGVVRDMLQGSYFFIIPRSNTFFIPRGSIKNEIEKTFPSIQKSSIQQKGLRSIHLALTEEVPAYEWCDPNEEKPQCFLMNSEGYVFALSHDDSTDFVQFRGDIEGVPIGQTYLAEDFQTLAQGITSIEKSVGEKIVSVSVDEHNDVTAYFTSGAYIQFVRSSSYEALLDAIVSIFSSKKIERAPALEYADFRFGNKVYVKFKEE